MITNESFFNSWIITFTCLSILFNHIICNMLVYGVIYIYGGPLSMLIHPKQTNLRGMNDETGK